ncbi:Bug family tripartite tricarboxylate transporter substrate binding protein [Paralcaligenes ginsengisoli]
MKTRLYKLGMCVGFALIGSSAHAGSYPDRPITLIVPSAPGGTTDVSARAVAQNLAKILGQPVVVENKPGASGNIGNAFVSRAKPDGYTLLLSYSGYHTGNPALFKTLTWDPVKDFTPIAEVSTAPHVIVVPNTLKVSTLKDFLALAKSEPGKLNYASSGAGSIQHLGTEQLKQLTGINMLHVPYKGAGPAMQDLLAGQVQLFITTPPSVIGQIKAGRVKALAIASDTRHPMLPDVPTTAEAGLPNYKLEAWFSVFGPAHMPADVTAILTKALKKVVADKSYQANMESQGAYAKYLPPDQLEAEVKSDIKHWQQVIKTAGIKPL